jgi:hypothetical protein
MLILFRFKILIANVMFDYLAGTPDRVFFDLVQTGKFVLRAPEISVAQFFSNDEQISKN